MRKLVIATVVGQLIYAVVFATPSAAAQQTPTTIEATTEPAVSLDSLESGPFRPDSLELANIVIPQEAFEGMLKASLINGLRIGLGDDAVTLEKEYPGIIAEMESAVVKEALPALLKSRDDDLRRYARLFTQFLDVPETADLQAFYKSLLGQKMLAAKYAHISKAENLENLFANDQTTTSDISKFNREVAMTVVPELTAQDKIELLQLMGRPTFAKMVKLVPIINKLEAEAANEEDPALEAKISAAIVQVIDRRTERK